MPFLPSGSYRKTRGIHRMGTRADQPSATTVLNGTIYFVTDEIVLERANGASWDRYSFYQSAGSWTPVIGGAGGTTGQSYNFQAGKFIKTEKLVWISFNVKLTNKGTITSGLQIQGLPYTIENTVNGAPKSDIGFDSLNTSFVQVSGFGAVGDDVIDLYGMTAAGTSSVSYNLTTTDVINTSHFFGTLAYETSS